MLAWSTALPFSDVFAIFFLGEPRASHLLCSNRPLRGFLKPPFRSPLFLFSVLGHDPFGLFTAQHGNADPFFASPATRLRVHLLWPVDREEVTRPEVDSRIRPRSGFRLGLFLRFYLSWGSMFYPHKYISSLFVLSD